MAPGDAGRPLGWCLSPVSSFPPPEETDKMLSIRQTFRKAPFKSYHFPCLFHVAWRGQGSSLHTRGLKNKTIEQHPECVILLRSFPLPALLSFKNSLSLRKQKRCGPHRATLSPSSTARVHAHPCTRSPLPSQGPCFSCSILIRRTE